MTNDGATLKKLTPKQELSVTLDRAWEALQSPTPVNLAILRGLLDHARALVKRVGNEQRAPKKLSAVRA